MKQSCKLLGISQQAYYQHQKYEPQKKDHSQEVINYITELRKEQPLAGIQPCYQGFKLLHPNLLGLHRFTKIARKSGLIQKAKARKIITTQSDPSLGVSPDLYNGKKHERPNQFWVSDITHIKHKGETSYLFLTMDAFSRKILGWVLAKNMAHKHAIRAFQMAVSNSGVAFNKETQKVLNDLVHHSDKGGQYQAKNFKSILDTMGVKSSMTQGADSRKNAKAERVNGIIKNDFLIPFGSNNMNYKSLTKLLDKIIGTYNNKRLHNSLGYKTPNQVHRGSKTARLWKSRWEKPRCMWEYIGEYIEPEGTLIA